MNAARLSRVTVSAPLIYTTHMEHGGGHEGSSLRSSRVQLEPRRQRTRALEVSSQHGRPPARNTGPATKTFPYIRTGVTGQEATVSTGDPEPNASGVVAVRQELKVGRERSCPRECLFLLVSYILV